MKNSPGTKIRNRLRKSKIKYSDLWTKSERKVKKKSEDFRGGLFYPIVYMLSKLKITANMVSYSSAILGIAATVYMWYDLKISGILLIISLLLDGIDGPLARYTKAPRLRGSLTDAFTDQTVISATTIGMIATGLINPIIGGVYLVVYPILVILVIIRNIINKPSLYVMRPRFFVYASFLLFAFWGVDWMNYVVTPATAIISVYFVYNFFKLRSFL